jgi:anthranilate synthase component 2
MKILMIDNYDSFTYNLVHYLEALGAEVVVKRNDEITVEDALKYERIVLSPGPGLPKDAGIMPRLIENITTQKVLGICLGHQAIAEAFGGKIYNLKEVQHGVPGQLKVESDSDLFSGIDDGTEIGRYHSWSVDSQLPSGLECLAIEKGDKSIMAIKHASKAIYGLQFHPESVLTPQGKQILKNWMTL